MKIGFVQTTVRHCGVPCGWKTERNRKNQQRQIENRMITDCFSLNFRL